MAFNGEMHDPCTYGFDCPEWIADLGPPCFDVSTETLLDSEDPVLEALPDLQPEDEEALLSLCDPVALMLAAKCDELEARGDQLFSALYEGRIPVNGLCNVRCGRTFRLCSLKKDHSKKAGCLHSWEEIASTEGRASRKRSRFAGNLEGFPFC